MLWLIIPAVVVLALLALTFGLYCFVFFNPLPHRENIYNIPSTDQYQLQRELMVSLIREMAEIPCEMVNITSYDGTRLSGRYYHVRDEAPLQIQIHGYRGSAIRDFCGGNKLAREAGFNTLVVDQRAHGRSGGVTISFGLRERYDCLYWARWAAERFPGKPVILAGVSMGAATVLMAAGLDLPDNVKGIIADCPYSSPVDIIMQVGRDKKLPVRLLYPFVWLAARLFGRFDLRETTAAKEVRKAKVPILIIHGEDDRFVPCQMSRQIYETCPTARMRVTVPGAGHALSYIVDPDTYSSAVADFLKMIHLTEVHL